MAGEATKSANVTKELVKILDGKGYLTVTRADMREQLRIIDMQTVVAEKMGADNVVGKLKAFRGELIDLVQNEQSNAMALIQDAAAISEDTLAFVEKFTNARKGLVGPDDFQQVSKIMSEHLSARAPVTDTFINFWKSTAETFIKETKSTDIPWVTFDGKLMMQRYRPKLQERIEFKDPVTGRRVMNIYQTEASDGALLGKGSITKARTGLGVSGNHANDASIVRQFHLWGERNNVSTGTIHDAFFTNLSQADDARSALRNIYADSLDGKTIQNTLKAMKKAGLSNRTYKALIKEAKQLGLIDPPNAITRKDILAPIPKGMDWYGVGP